MPTGYTADLKLTTPFQEFAIKCARAMGACIMMRDDPMDAPIPDEFPPSDYHAKALEEAKAKQAALAEMSVAAAAVNLQQHNERQAKEAADSKVRYREQRKIYERMLAMVRDWQPPTPDHENFKKFMVEQLTGSIEFDCHDDKADEWHKPFAGTPEAWLDELRSKAAWEVNYHAEEHRKEVERSAGRTNWVRALRDSLKAYDGQPTVA